MAIVGNEYFNGQVKSLTLASEGHKATVGVIAPGTYEFGTSSLEIMTVVSGILEACLPGEEEFSAYTVGMQFQIPKGEKFKVRCQADVAYLCVYV